MRSLKLPVLFCEPSFASGLLVIISSITLLVFSDYSYLLKSDLIRNTFSPDGSAVDGLLVSSGTMHTFRATVLSNPALNKVLFFCFWMIVGLFVYVILATVWDSFSNAGSAIESTHYVHARRDLIQNNLLVRLAIQVGGVLSLIVFGVIFASLLYPFSILSTRVGFSELNTFAGWGYALLGLVVLTLSLHCFVIIGRLIMARPRMIGGWDSLLMKKGIKPPKTHR